MSETITGRFFAVREKDFQDSIGFLDRLGMAIAEGTMDSLFFHIQVREKPEALRRLEETSRSKAYYHILRISYAGIMFSVPGPHRNSYLFIPRENILAIHTDEQAHDA
ncbi:MAG: hypothetical protein KKA73_15145 [Chloroflexi bacterium]|nr:hypothetical protein [Chloroflexota bacterium]MBU1749022.1 hypothetical protein [Chloroflexota bacterium]